VRPPVLHRLTCIAWLLLAACGGDSSPTAAPPPPLAPPSALAAQYLGEIMDLMQARSLHRYRIDWAKFRTDVLAAAAGAQSVRDTYPAIMVALRALGDDHSIYQSPGGAIMWAGTRICFAPAPARPTLPAGVGYVAVGAFSGGGGAATTFATGIQDAIRAADDSTITGWVVDLRGNGGGNMWPMLAGVGPVLGEGVAGHFIAADGLETAWIYQGGTSIIGGTPVVRVEQPYQLRRTAPRVAVLIDLAVGSSGEATAIAFKGRPDTRFFGMPTCGLSTANQGFPLSDGAVLNLTTAVMADRHKRAFGGMVEPDERTGSTLELERRLAEWFRSGS